MSKPTDRDRPEAETDPEPVISPLEPVSEVLEEPKLEDRLTLSALPFRPTRSTLSDMAKNAHAPLEQFAIRIPGALKEEIGRVAARARRTPSSLANELLQDGLRRPRLSPVLECFVDEIRQALGPAADFAEAFSAMDVEGDGNPAAISFMMAVEWIACHRLKSVGERLAMIERLRRLQGHQVLNLREFTGWQ